MAMTSEQKNKVNEIKANECQGKNAEWQLWFPRKNKAMMTATYSQSNGIKRVARFQISPTGKAWKLRPNGKIVKTL